MPLRPTLLFIPSTTIAMSEVLNKQFFVRKLDQFLASGNFRRTPERYKVLDVVLGFSKHFSVADIQAKLQQDNFYLSLATIYNTLRLFVRANIIKSIDFEGADSTQYVVNGITSNVYLYCTTCGKIKDVRDTDFITFMNTRKYTAFKADHYSLLVYGTCNTCARKRNNSINKKSPTKKSLK